MTNKTEILRIALEASIAVAACLTTVAILLLPVISALD